jgi:phytoene dehydrogenase-like protein
MPEAGVAAASSAAGVLTFHHDPGELSAAFVAGRIRRILLHPRPVARYVVGGWSVLIDALAEAARARGVRIETGVRLTELPGGGPAIVATSLAGARRLTGDASLVAPGTRTILLDVGVARRRRDPGVVFDLDDAAFANRYSDRDPGLAPDGHELIQAQLGARPGESLAEGVARLESLLDAAFGDWRGREVWRRRSLVEDQSGAVDRPGTTWRDRPAVDRGDDVFLCGDQVAAPGHLAEVSWASALEAAHLAVVAAAVGVGARG